MPGITQRHLPAPVKRLMDWGVHIAFRAIAISVVSGVAVGSIVVASGQKLSLSLLPARLKRASSFAFEESNLSEQTAVKKAQERSGSAAPSVEGALDKQITPQPVEDGGKSSTAHSDSLSQRDQSNDTTGSVESGFWEVCSQDFSFEKIRDVESEQPESSVVMPTAHSEVYIHSSYPGTAKETRRWANIELALDFKQQKNDINYERKDADDYEEDITLRTYYDYDGHFKHRGEYSYERDNNVSKENRQEAMSRTKPDSSPSETTEDVEELRSETAPVSIPTRFDWTYEDATRSDWSFGKRATLEWDGSYGDGINLDWNGIHGQDTNLTSSGSYEDGKKLQRNGSYGSGPRLDWSGSFGSRIQWSGSYAGDCSPSLSILSDLNLAGDFSGCSTPNFELPRLGEHLGVNTIENMDKLQEKISNIVQDIEGMEQHIKNL